MSFLVFLLSFALFAASVVFLCLALGLHKLDAVKNAPPPSLSQRFSARWLGAALGCFVLIPVIFLTLYAPIRAYEQLGSVKGFVQRTFKEKLGRLPDTLELQRIAATGQDEDWRYAGAGSVDGRQWDVLVTRNSKRYGGKQVGDAEWTCTLTPRGESAPVP